MNKQTKRSKEEMMIIHNECMESFLRGNSKRQIIDELIRNGEGRLNAEHIVRNALKGFHAKSEEETENLRSLYSEMYMDLFKKATLNREYNNAKNILDSLMKIQGMNSEVIKQTVNHTFDVEF